jgi:basic amino acid/polyamine antiporter, APA family
MRPAAAHSLGLWDAVSIIVGIVIGAGIYETPPLVLASVSGPAELAVVWTLGGLLSLIGACCYAELASTYPRSGGDYVYLSRAFSPLFGFLFGWAQLAVIMTSSIGMMAFVFADYAAELWGLGREARPLLAASAVFLLSACNVVGLAAGKTTQNALSLLKLVGLAGIAVSGLLLAGAGRPAPSSAGGSGSSSLGLAMILVLYTYGGWNDAAYVAAEVREPRRNLPRALLLGTGAVTLVYLAVNAAFVRGLGFERARASSAIATDLTRAALGDTAGLLLGLLVMVSALGAVNAMILTGARVTAALGADYPALGRLGRVDLRRRSPTVALLAQLAVTLALIGALGSLGGRGGFEQLLRCTAPVFWLFFLLTGLALLVLRFREPQRARPFRVPLYPLLPLIFCATSAAMLVASVRYAGKLALIGLILLALGVPLYFGVARRGVLPSAACGSGWQRGSSH